MLTVVRQAELHAEDFTRAQLRGVPLQADGGIAACRRETAGVMRRRSLIEIAVQLKPGHDGVGRADKHPSFAAHRVARRRRTPGFGEHVQKLQGSPGRRTVRMDLDHETQIEEAVRGADVADLEVDRHQGRADSC